MIAKKRTTPLQLYALESLISRMRQKHKKRSDIEGDLTKRKTGFKGELALDYELGKLQGNNYYIFQDLRLKSGHLYFQLDTLLLTKHFGLILEIKNIKGTLFFDNEFGQMIRTYEDKEEGFKDPLIQAGAQRSLLREFLKENKLETIPIEYFIVISHASTILKSSQGYHDAKERVFHADHLIQKIASLQKKYKNIQVKKSKLDEIKQKLLSSHSPLLSTPLEYYQITKEEILPGVHCPSCSHLGMERIYGKWPCPKCKFTSVTAHEQAIIDYLLLLNPTISNSQCRKFLGLKSRKSAHIILNRMNLEKTGTNKGTVYRLKEGEAHIMGNRHINRGSGT